MCCWTYGFEICKISVKWQLSFCVDHISHNNGLIVRGNFFSIVEKENEMNGQDKQIL